MIKVTNCKQCDADITPKSDSRQKFCNSSCSAIFNNKLRIKKLYTRSKQACVTCGTKLRMYQDKVCSAKCGGSARWSATKRRIENNIGNVAVGTLRKYLHETRKHACELCKGTDWFGKPIPLVMDHIDGNPTNNSLVNLRLICPNCDRFLPTFGSRNRGSGRTSRGIKR